MVKRYVVYAANCICDAPPNSDGQYVLVADYDALAARLAEAERHLRNMYAMVHGKVPPDHPFTLSNVSDFLRLNPADESTASSASDALP